MSAIATAGGVISCFRFIVVAPYRRHRNDLASEARPIPACFSSGAVLAAATGLF
jgi:hypothetical protein